MVCMIFSGKKMLVYYIDSKNMKMVGCILTYFEIELFFLQLHDKLYFKYRAQAMQFQILNKVFLVPLII